MSKNSKQRKRNVEAKTRNRPKGYKGPASTKPAHGKKKAWWQLKDANGRLLVLTNKGKNGKKTGRRAANDEDVSVAA
jgi:hypothetical protein